MASFSRVPVCVVWKQEFRGGLRCAAHRTSKVARRCRWRLCPLSTQALMIIIITIMLIMIVAPDDTNFNNANILFLVQRVQHSVFTGGHFQKNSKLTWASCLLSTHAVARSVSTGILFLDVFWGLFSVFSGQKEKLRGKMYNPRFNTQMLVI